MDNPTGPSSKSNHQSLAPREPWEDPFGSSDDDDDHDDDHQSPAPAPAPAPASRELREGLVEWTDDDEDEDRRPTRSRQLGKWTPMITAWGRGFQMTMMGALEAGITPETLTGFLGTMGLPGTPSFDDRPSVFTSNGREICRAPLPIPEGRVDRVRLDMLHSGMSAEEVIATMKAALQPTRPAILHVDMSAEEVVAAIKAALPPTPPRIHGSELG